MRVRKLRVLLLRLTVIPFIFLAVFVRPSWGENTRASLVIEAVGYLFLLAGMGIRMWSILYIGGRKSYELVTTGPYSICRNPLYVGTFLLAIGVGLSLESIPILVAALVVYVPIHFIVVRMEEKHLESRFPTEYPVYKRKVPMLLPRFGNYRGSPELPVSPRAVRRLIGDTFMVLLIPLVEDLLEALHGTGLIPVLWHCP
jgi:protein-S-isoprenylcysteine O-methyltransferase Ste14